MAEWKKNEAFYQRLALGVGALMLLFMGGCLGHVAASSVPAAILVAMALLFDFENGANDAANSIATVVSTGVLQPAQAVLWAATFNFLAAFISLHAVAITVGMGIIDPAIIDQWVLLAVLVGATLATHVATSLGMPISSTHALIGAMAGAAWAAVGPQGIQTRGLFFTFMFIFLAPMMGYLLAVIIGILTSWVFHRMRPGQVDGFFRKMQLFSSAMYSLGHGANDAQKTMGIVSLILYICVQKAAGKPQSIEPWIVFVCCAAMALGTLFGGWRVIHTTGYRLTRLRPFGGFCAELSAALTIFQASGQGIPISTTHTIIGSILGVGTLHRVSAVRWGLAITIIWAWVLTMPFAFAVSYATHFLIQMLRPLL